MNDAIKLSDSTYLRVSVSTNKPKKGIKEYNKWRNRLEIDLTKKAQRNKANKELRTYISNLFSISSRKVKISNGKRSSKKIVEINGLGLSKQEIKEKIKEEIK